MVSHPSHRLTPLGYVVVGLLRVKDPAGVPFSFDPYAAHAAHPPYNWHTCSYPGSPLPLFVELLRRGYERPAISSPGSLVLSLDSFSSSAASPDCWDDLQDMMNRQPSHLPPRCQALFTA